MISDHRSNNSLSNYTCIKQNLHVFFFCEFFMFFDLSVLPETTHLSMKYVQVTGGSPMVRTVSECNDPDLFRDLNLLTHRSDFLINWKPGPRSFHGFTQVLVGTVQLFKCIHWWKHLYFIPPVLQVILPQCPLLPLPYLLIIKLVFQIQKLWSFKAAPHIIEVTWDHLPCSTKEC